ncbi:bifunctional copper resistance protein CopD/cytochrome c oxidase assembly protein [Oerskovia sp. Sa4CUA1]|uniref:Bifunctional copper resistance protein CopD/cytochrome c oxidase assembly protein n=1 Tax=Oerskovia rustica TaxID=2762237 RepID=A0ABR8RUY0_9CELL|nr:bifunctional copper resistance protein CopD/cytochrome c oxidase assembly protein [Oerskovia rustica]
MPAGASRRGAWSTGEARGEVPVEAHGAALTAVRRESTTRGEYRDDPHAAYPGRVTATAPRSTSGTAPDRAAQAPGRGVVDAPRNPWWLVLSGPAAVVVAILSVVAAGAFSGAFQPLAGFADPGAVARWGLPISTTLTELAIALTIGSLVLAACVLPAGPPLRKALGVAGAASAVWAVLTVVQTILRYSVLSSMPVTSVGFGEQLAAFVTQISLGRSLLGVIVVAALTSACAFAVRTATGALWTALLALSALAFQANTGHTAGAASHELAISSMFLHLGGAALWIGGLGVLAIVRLRGGLDRTAFAYSVSRYSSIAGWSFVAVAVSGVANAWIRLGGVAGLSTDYGVLILTKIGLIVVLGAIGFAHRELVVRRLQGVGGPIRGPRTTATSPGTTTAVGEPGVAGGSAVGQKNGKGGPQAAAEKAATWLFWRLVAVELLVMGAVSGVAVALGSTAPPVPDEPIALPTPAEIVTGHPLPPEPDLGRWFSEWRWDLLPAFACVAALVVYLRWVRRLAQRGDRWPLGRTVSWCAGIVVLFWVTNGGPAVYGHVLFSAHMVQHMVLAMVVPIFLVLAAPVTLLLRAVPVRKDGSRGPREWVLALVTSKWGQFFANPIVAAVNFAGSMIVFYYTPAFELAMTTYVGHLVMLLHFTLAGYLFANALVGIDPGPHRPGWPQRLLLLLVTMAFHAFFGVSLTTGTQLLVPEWFGLMGHDWGITAIADQQRGGGVAWGIGELPTLSLAIVVAVMWARSDEKDAKRRDRRVDQVGDVEMDEYNKMLAKMAEQDKD